MLLKDIKNIFHRELDTLYPLEEVNSFFYRMIEHYLGLERFVLAIEPDISMTKEEEAPLFEGLAQLKLERPLQYILGKTYFMDLEFVVNEHVLIPRPETEELTRWIIGEVQKNKPTVRILDIGTGSGCIAISLAKYIPNAEVLALDVSNEALKIAKENATGNDVDVDFFQWNILSKKTMGRKFDIIVSNPPYVRQLEKKEILKNVKDFEPGLALFVSNEEPLIFFDGIGKFAKEHLDKEGQLYLEINQYLGKETEQLLKHQNFLEIELRKDMFGNDRMLRGRLD